MKSAPNEGVGEDCTVRGTRKDHLSGQQGQEKGARLWLRVCG